MPIITQRRVAMILLAAIVIVGTGRVALAQKKYDTGASDTEIKIGNIVPYSGPASAYGTVGKAMAAVFRKVNDDGGINGRKINFISYDDAYSPPKAVEQARKLIESDDQEAGGNELAAGYGHCIECQRLDRDRDEARRSG